VVTLPFSIPLIVFFQVEHLHPILSTLIYFYYKINGDDNFLEPVCFYILKIFFKKKVYFFILKYFFYIFRLF